MGEEAERRHREGEDEQRSQREHDRRACRRLSA
jgi:hypothetical protein